MWVRHPVSPGLLPAASSIARCLGLGRPGGQEAPRTAADARRARPRSPPASSACAMSSPPKLAILGMAARSWSPVQRRELVDAGGQQEALEAHHARVVQGRRSAALPGTAPPQNATSTASWPAAAACLAAQRGHGHGRRDAVQRHVHDRGHPARRGGGRRGREPFPLGAPGLVDVHVAVHQPGQQHLVRGQGEGAGRRVAVSRPPR